MRKTLGLQSLIAVMIACMSLGMISACKTVSHSEAELKHDVGVYVSSSAPWQWGTFSRKDYEGSLSFLGPFGRSLGLPTFVAGDPPIAKRMQKWVDAIHSRVIAKMPADLAKAIPTPNIILARQDFSMNAAVAQVLVETPQPVVFGSWTDALKRPALPYWGMMTYRRDKDVIESSANPLTVALNVFTSKNQGAQRAPLDAKDIVPWVQWQLTPRNGPNCDVKAIKKDGLTGNILVPAGCAKEGEKPYFIKTPLRMGMLPNWIMVNTGSFAAFNSHPEHLVADRESIKPRNEAMLVAVIAHELAHYYRGDSLVPEKESCYEYKAGDKNPSCKPINQAVDWAEMQALGHRKVVTKLLEDNILVRPDGQKQSDGYTLNGKLGKIAKETCPAYVQTLLDYSNLEYQMNILKGRFIGDLLKKMDKLTDELFETRQQCFQANNMSSPLGRALLAVWQEYAAGKVFSEISFKEGTSIWDFFFKNIPWGIYDLLPDSYYTYEQQADEIALELAVDMGLSPEDVIEAIMHLVPYGNQKLCRKALENNWPKTMSDVYDIGSTKDPHHSGCYRVRNLWREAEAHGWPLKQADNRKLPFPLLSKAEWDDLTDQILKPGNFH